MEDFTFGLTTPAILKIKISNVVGQEEAKRILCTALWKKLEYNYLKKTNVLLVGPSGSGKTYLVESLAKILEIPIVIVDASTFTEAGWKGNDIENIFAQLIEVAGGDIARAEQGIVVLDEIDKKGATNALEYDCVGRGAQHNMLRMLEDGVISLKDGRSIKTDKIMFVACGAFQKVENIVKARQQRLVSEKTKKSSMNLVNDFEEKAIESPASDYVAITREDIIKYGGMIPEFIGRFDIVVNLEPLNEEHIMQILKNEKGGALKEYKQLFELNGYDLQLEDEVLLGIVKDAMAKGLGARGIRAALDKLLLYPLFSVASKETELDNELIKLELKQEKIKNGQFPFNRAIARRKYRS